MGRRSYSKRMETKYRDFEIYYDEDTDLWRCSDLNMDGPSLSAVKNKIAAQSKSERAINAHALHFGNDRRTDAFNIQKVLVTVLCEPESDYRGALGQQKIKNCWVTLPDGSRVKTSIETLYPMDAADEMKAWIKSQKEIEALQEKADDLHASITKHDADSLMLLAKEQQEATPRVRTKRKK